MTTATRLVFYGHENTVTVDVDFSFALIFDRSEKGEGAMFCAIKALAGLWLKKPDHGVSIGQAVKAIGESGDASTIDALIQVDVLSFEAKFLWPGDAMFVKPQLRVLKGGNVA